MKSCQRNCVEIFEFGCTQTMLRKEHLKLGFLSWRAKVAVMVTMFVVMAMAMADSDVDGGDKFDYFVFSQEWRGTYCEAKASCCQSLKEPVEFSIHGVWPEFNDGSWPECCDGPAFNMTKVVELADDLQKYWPTLYCSPPR